MHSLYHLGCFEYFPVREGGHLCIHLMWNWRTQSKTIGIEFTLSKQHIYSEIKKRFSVQQIMWKFWEGILPYCCTVTSEREIMATTGVIWKWLFKIICWKQLRRNTILVETQKVQTTLKAFGLDIRFRWVQLDARGWKQLQSDAVKSHGVALLQSVWVASFVYIGNSNLCLHSIQSYCRWCYEDIKIWW